jgi:hypothetical protein
MHAVNVPPRLVQDALVYLDDNLFQPSAVTPRDDGSLSVRLDDDVEHMLFVSRFGWAGA